MRKVIAASVLGLMMCLHLTWAQDESEPFVMRHGYHVYDAPWHLTAGITFTQWLEDATDHKIRVENYNNFSIRQNEDLINYIQEGKLDSAVLTLETLAAHNPKFNMFFMPYLFENSEVAHQVMDDFLLDWINEQLKPLNIVALGILDFGFRQICTNRPNLKTLDDFKGLTLASSNRDIFIEAMGKIGINLRKTPYEDLYKVLAFSQVDGAEHLVSVMVAKQLNKLEKHLYLTNHFYEFMPMVFSMDFINKLPPDIQQALRETVKRAQELNRSMCSKHEADYVQYLSDQGMTVHGVSSESFRRNIDAVYESISQHVGQGDDLWELFFAISRARYAVDDQRQHRQ